MSAANLCDFEDPIGYSQDMIVSRHAKLLFLGYSPLHSAPR